jgi:flagellar hook-basal body complex protein FliE
MADMKVTGLKNTHVFDQVKDTTESSGGGFQELMAEAMGKITQVQRDAETAVKELVSGGDITQAVIAMEKADLSFQLMVEVRNRLLSAYEEISRMQV